VPGCSKYDNTSLRCHTALQSHNGSGRAPQLFGLFLRLTNITRVFFRSRCLRGL
jgi:hypothetical protein